MVSTLDGTGSIRLEFGQIMEEQVLLKLRHLLSRRPNDARRTYHRLVVSQADPFDVLQHSSQDVTQTW